MIGRLANVIYWVACICAGLFFALISSALWDEPNQRGLGLAIGLMGAVIIWGVGRVIRYVLVDS